MNRFLYTALLGALAIPAFATDVGVSLSIGQPGFYGQIDIGHIAPPPVVYAQPVVIAPTPQYVSAAPIYLHVPPGHEKHWSKHCGEYHACGRQVYFVKDDWYNNEYVPHYKHEDGDSGHGHGHGHDRDHNHGKGHDRD